jgi:hypothetical protein
MRRPDTRRRRAEAPRVAPLEARQMLSAAHPMPPGKAAEIVAQSFRNAQAAPQSPSPATTRVTVATDRPNYAPGDPVRLTISQAVAGNTPVNTGPLVNYDVVVSQRGRELWRLSDTRGPVVGSHVLVTMQPGEARQVTATWNGRGRDGQVVTGPVEIRAEVDRVGSSPRVVQIGATRPTARPASFPNRTPADRPSPVAMARPDRGPSADLASLREAQQQLRRAAEARLASLDRPSRPTFPGHPVARRI